MNKLAKGWRRYFNDSASCDDCGSETLVACLIGNADESAIICPRCIRKYAETIPSEPASPVNT